MKTAKLPNKPMEFLGKAIKVFLKEGGAFYLKVTSCGIRRLHGYDDEGVDITIDTDDIDFIIM